MEQSFFESGSIRKVYFSLALPVVFSMVITIIYNMTDTYFIALTGNTNLVAGVSVCTPLFTLLMAIGNIFGQGGSSLISRLIGNRDTENLHKVSSFCFYTAIAFGLIAGTVLLFLRVPMLHLLGTDESTVGFASDYYVWLAIGAPIVTLSFIHTNLLRAEGKAKESMVGTIGGSVVNIILDPILIFILGLGAAGAALATILGYLFTDVFCLLIVMKKSKVLSVNPGKIKIHRAFVEQIFGIGFSAALSNVTQSVCLILTNKCLLSYGSDKIAAMGIVQRVSMIIMLVIVGFSFGGAPLIGYYYGSKNKEKLKEMFSFVLRFLVILAIIMSAVMCLSAPVVIRVFIKEEELIQIGVLMLRAQVLGMAFMAFVLFSTIIFQATGKTIPSLILALSRQGVVFVLVLIIAVLFAGYYGIIWTQFISDLISAVLAFLLLMNQMKKDTVLGQGVDEARQ